jgi:hypothetical protein
MRTIQPPAVELRDDSPTPDLYFTSFLVLWQSRPACRTMEFKVATYCSDGWRYPNRAKLGGQVLGWVSLPTIPK